MHDSYKQWLNNGHPKVYCGCNCNESIIIKKNHKYNGIPKYILGHNKAHLGKLHSEKTKQKIRENRPNNLGKNNPNFGKHPSEETKQKMRKKKLGIPLTEEHKQKIRNNSVSQSGDKNPNWQGGISFLPYCFRFNEKLKEEIRNRDNRICQECGKTESENCKKLSVHHIHYDKENCYPDLITLCFSCNNKANFNREYWEEHFMDMLEARRI